MICVKVTLKDGANWTTRINATLDGAKAYFLGKLWHSSACDEDLQSVAISVELID